LGEQRVFMSNPGKRNLITDVNGIKVGNAGDITALTGVTVLTTPGRAVAGVEQRGGAPGTRETDLLDPSCMVDAVDAIVLSGGSVYGLDAASAVTNLLGAQGKGFKLGDSPLVAPIVPAAILFDLRNGGDKAWGEEPPYRALGREALNAAGDAFELGNQGAGLGALSGAYKGGLGSASLVTSDGYEVGALVAVNSFGSPVMPGSKTLWAAPYALGEELGRAPFGDGVTHGKVLDFPHDTKAGALPGMNTTIGIVAVNATLTSTEAGRLATMAEDGLARALRPIHTPMDGDTVFAVATGTKPHDEAQKVTGDIGAATLARLGLIAADCLTRACGRAIWQAESVGAHKSFRRFLED
jgi:L-aminopeptidase/D-esterase-like protein